MYNLPYNYILIQDLISRQWLSLIGVFKNIWGGIKVLLKLMMLNMLNYVNGKIAYSAKVLIKFNSQKHIVR